MNIRPAEPRDAPALLDIILPVIRAGKTYALDTDMSAEDALAYWTGPDRETFVAEADGMLLGTYYLRPTRRVAGGTCATAAI
jgi:hypothetical protein